MRVMIVGAALAALLAGSAAAQGSHNVSGYYRSNGTYVAPHRQTNPDGNRFNNWSSAGNVNPYTGQPGSRPTYPSYGAPSYSYSAPTYSAPRQPRPRSCYGYGC